MKLPSLSHIYQKATITLWRFPFTLFSAAVVTGIIIYMTQVSLDNVMLEQMLGKITMCSFLGIPLFTAITLFVEKRDKNTVFWWLGHALGLVLLVVYYLTLPTSLVGSHYNDIYRYVLFVIGLHLLVAIAPFWGKSTQMSFWQYNKLLFLRFLTAILFSAVLYLGLALALLSIQILLGINIDYELYIQLYTLIGVMFNTWFFLAGIPTSLQTFGQRESYPKGLKIFAQNVLLPLVVIYMVILYLYMIKMIGQWTWPEGWVAILILSFSIVGILAILLLYPVRHKAENKWINRFYTGYFAALVPLVILLLLAIYRRVADYGVTIERYFVIVLALWLAGMVIYFLASKSQNIKVIPGSLCILAFVISFGPWGAFSVSRRSQVHRLETFLKKNEILQKGKIHKASSKVPNTDQQQIKSIVSYLNNTDDLGAIQPWFDESLTQETVQVGGKDSVQTIRHYSRRNRALALMGIDHYNRMNSSVAGSGVSAIKRYHVYPEQKDVFAIDHFDWFIRGLRWSENGEFKETYPINDRELVIESHKKDAKVYIYYKNAKQQTITANMDDIVRQLQNQVSPDQHKLSAKQLVFLFSNDLLNINLYVERFRWQVEGDSTKQLYSTFSVALK